MRCPLVGRALLVGCSVIASIVPPASAESVRPDPAGRSLQAVVDAAPPGAVIELDAGVFSGPVRIGKPLVLRGHGAVVDGGGRGTPIVIAAPRVRVEGLVVRDGGHDVGAPDACIFIEPAAEGAVVSGCLLERCTFGIWVHEVEGVELSSNRISGRAEVRSADRGNGIHLFDSSRLVVRDNVISDVRDGIYVSATEDSLIEDNIARGVRFGIHYMYSYRNSIRGNLTEGNTVGIALMESRDLEVIGNRSVGNIRNGLLFRDVQGSEIRGNWLERNGNGMFFFSSTENTIVGNHVIDNDIGLKVWAGTRRNRIEENILRGNREQVMYVGAEDQVWGGSGRGNVWGDYVGWDQDRDGVGDRPHRVDSFTASLLYRHPSAVLLLRSPAVEALAHLADRIPLLRVPTVIDLSPLVVEPEHEHGAAGVEGE